MRNVTGFWDGRDPQTGEDIGGYGTIQMPEYPPSKRGEALRAARVNGSVSLRVMALAMCLPAENYSGLERGKYEFIDESEWDRAMRLVEAQTIG
jgi:hypothetical protein